MIFFFFICIKSVDWLLTHTHTYTQNLRSSAYPLHSKTSSLKGQSRPRSGIYLSICDTFFNIHETVEELYFSKFKVKSADN